MKSMRKKILACALSFAVSFGCVYGTEAASRTEISQISVNKQGSNSNTGRKKLLLIRL